MRFIIDIESNNLLQNALDYSTLPYRLKDDFRVWCVVLRNVEDNSVSTFFGDSLTKDNLRFALESCTELIGHNIVGFDLPVLMLSDLLEYRIGYPGETSTLFGNPVLISDTLLWSKLLNADRLGGHSLDAWGKRLGNYKEHFDNWNELSQEMLDYCIQDTSVNRSIFFELKKECGRHDWSRPYSAEVKLADLTLKQELVGFELDQDLAKKNLADLTEKMQKIAEKVDPLLPPKPLTKGAASEFIAPKIKFKKNGELSAVFTKWLNKHGAEVSQDRTKILYQGNEFPLLGNEPIVSHEPATIEDINIVKIYLIQLGWVPSEVKERDLVKNLNKTAKTRKEIIDTIDRYVKQTITGVFCDLRLDLLGCTKDNLRDFLLAKIDDTKPIYVPTTPKISVGLEKEICPNLVQLGEKAAFVKDVVEYYTYRHRKNSISGGFIDEDGEPSSGFLSSVREDGRVPTPADTLGANTGRYRHKIVCNIPRVTSLYGEQMRSMFKAGNGWYQLGYDFASLEARVMGHYVIGPASAPYTDGYALAESLVAEKPNDIHCYSEDTEILTTEGWKTFGALVSTDRVAQYEDGKISFVVPNEIVWQQYNGDMLVDPNTGFKVTPEHRVYYRSHTAERRCRNGDRICLASEFKPSSDKRFVLGGITQAPALVGYSDAELRFIVATQADGYLNKDCSAISFTFVKERKIQRMQQLLDELSVPYNLSTHNRKGRDEYTFRVNSGAFTKHIRAAMDADKTPKNFLLLGSYAQLTLLVNEIAFWDGTTKANGDIVLDSTSKGMVDFTQTVCSLIGKKCKVSSYVKKTNFGGCLTHRAYISNKNNNNTMAANRQLQVESYSGYIGCVSVPSGLVLVRRNGVTLVSGNTLNGKKLGIDRSAAKSFSYAAIYGAQPKKLSKMLGISEDEGKRLFAEYWDAVPALKELKQKVEKAWTSTGKKTILGLDGRLLNTRSKHSLINVLFQSGGAICAKWSALRLAQEMEKHAILGDPFKHSKEEHKVWWLIHMHDEQQMAVHPNLMKVQVFKTDDEAKQNLTDGCSAIGHGTKGPYVGYRTLPVECIASGIKSAVAELGLRVDLGFEWIPGANWGQCH